MDESTSLRRATECFVGAYAIEPERNDSEWIWYRRGWVAAEVEERERIAAMVEALCQDGVKCNDLECLKHGIAAMIREGK